MNPQEFRLLLALVRVATVAPERLTDDPSSMLLPLRAEEEKAALRFLADLAAELISDLKRDLAASSAAARTCASYRGQLAEVMQGVQAFAEGSVIPHGSVSNRVARSLHELYEGSRTDQKGNSGMEL